MENDGLRFACADSHPSPLSPYHKRSKYLVHILSSKSLTNIITQTKELVSVYVASTGVLY